MSWTKLDLIKKAFSKIGLASYVYDLDSEQIQEVAQELDSMLAEWNAQGIRLSYPISSGADVDVNVDSGLPDSAVSAVFNNLAVRIAGDYGKVVPPDLSRVANKAYKAMLIKSVKPIARQFPRDTIAGQGNKPIRRNTPFLPDPTYNVQAGEDGDIILE